MVVSQNNRQKGVAQTAASFILSKIERRKTMKNRFIPLNIQLFAEEGDPSGTGDNGVSPKGRTFTEDYVKGLRQESAGYRTTAKTYEATLRSVLGVGDGEELGDLNARVSTFQSNITAQQQKRLRWQTPALSVQKSAVWRATMRSCLKRSSTLAVSMWTRTAVCQA